MSRRPLPGLRLRMSGHRLLAITAWSLCAIGTSAPGAWAQDRAYELVTPAGRNADIRTVAGTPSASTPDGNTVCYGTAHNPDGPPVGDELRMDGYCSHRGAHGWTAEWVTAPYGSFLGAGTFGPRIRFTSEDGSRHAFFSDRPISDDIRDRVHGYVRADGETTWVTGPNGSGTDAVFRVPLAADANVTKIVFEAGENLLPGDSNGVTDVYEWADGATRLVSQASDGTAVGGTVGKLSPNEGIRNVMSRDGSRVFFQSSASLDGSVPSGTQSVYVREGDDVRLVSPRRNPGAPSPEPISFVGASRDGDVVYLSTAEQLTEDPKLAGTAIYRYTLSADALELVATGPGIQPYMVSDDGSSVFYLAMPGAPTLFVARDGGEPIQIAALTPLDMALPYRVASGGPHQRALRVTPDGRVAVFASASPLAPGAVPNVSQVYRWELGEGLERVSGPPVEGATPTIATIGNFATLFPMFPGRFDVTEQVNAYSLGGRVLSDDGRSVFFDSHDRLVPEDANAVSDVYEWRDGQVRLVSTGKSDTNSFYLGNSADGQTVFFTTWEQILPRSDRNDVRDLYAARIGGGGFPEPVPGTVGVPRAPDAPGASPPTPRVGSGDARAGEQAAPVLRRALTLGTLRRVAARRAARTGRLRLSVRVRGGGRVVAQARARIGGTQRVVGRGVRVVRRTSSTRALVVVRLTKAARRQLRSNRALRLRIAVGLSGEPGARRKTVVLRLPKKARAAVAKVVSLVDVDQLTRG